MNEETRSPQGTHIVVYYGSRPFMRTEPSVILTTWPLWTWMDVASSRIGSLQASQ